MIHDLEGTIVFEWTSSTIVISDTLALPQPLEQHFDQLRLATPLWIEHTHRHSKVYQIEHYSPDPKMIFTGFIVYGHKIQQDNGDLQTLYGGVEAFGGQWRMKFTSDVTHVVAYQDDDQVCSDAIKDGIKVILPEYFDDCFRLRQICKDTHYLFPEPGIYKCDLADLLNVKSMSRSTSQIQIDPNPLFLQHQVVFIDPDLIPEGCDIEKRENLPKWIKNMFIFGIKYTTNLGNATMVVTDIQYTIYEKAKQALIRVGTRRWMRDQVKQEKMIDPTSAILYYPRPHGIVPEMKNCTISVTNYVGQAREDILMMARLLGANVTRTMSAENTHLICANPFGEKYEKALKWNIHIVNHFWLEDVYVKWQYQKEAKPKYGHFAVGIGDMVNKSNVQLARTPSLPFTGPVFVGEQLESTETTNTPILKNVAPLAEAVKIAVQNTIVADGQPSCKPIDSLAVEKEKVGPVEHSESKRDTSSETETGEKENNITTIVQNASSKPAILDTPSSRKRSIDTVPNSITNSKSKKSKRTTKRLKVLFTGVRPIDSLMKQLPYIGLKTTESMNDFDLLVTNRVARTEKFLTAISKGKPIVQVKWIEESVDNQKTLDYNDFLVVDDTIDLKASIKRSIEKPLFQGYRIFVTQNVLPVPVILKRLVEASGGIIEPIVTPQNQNTSLQHCEKFLFVSATKDQSLFEPFIQQRIPIYTTDFLLNCILKQEITPIPQDIHNYDSSLFNQK